MLWFRRIFFGIWCLLFILFAVVQYNDPDPLLWMGIYGGAAILSGMAAMGRFPMPLLMAGAVLCFIGFIYYYPDSVSEWIQQEWQQQDLTMKTQNMEEARESFGFLTVAIVMSGAALMGWRSHQAGAASTKTVSGKPKRV